MTTTVFVADDHAVVREGIKALVNAESDLKVVGEAADGISAVESVLQLEPQVAILDINLPGLSGIEVAEQLRLRSPRVRSLALSVHEDRTYLRQFLAAGGSGYVLKRSLAEDLAPAIRKIAAGEQVIDPNLLKGLVNGDQNHRNLQTILERTRLSEREDEVLRLIAQGHSHKEIAAKLGLSAKTVETYKMRSFEKLGLKSRADVVRHAVQQGWLAAVCKAD
jgi:DNA-binding NarL/FixJ family response regulator